MGGNSSLKGFAFYALSGLQIAGAVGILLLVKKWLWEYDQFSVEFYNSVDPGSNTCLLTYNSVNLCAYMYVVVGFGMSVALTLLFTTCFNKRIWLGFQAIMSAFGVLWWTPAAISTTIYGYRADTLGVPKKGARMAVWCICWGEVGLCAIALISVLWDCYRPRKGVKACRAIDPKLADVESSAFLFVPDDSMQNEDAEEASPSKEQQANLLGQQRDSQQLSPPSKTPMFSSKEV